MTPTINLQITRHAKLSRWLAQQDMIALLAIAVVALLIGGAALRQYRASVSAPALAVPTLAPVILLQTMQPAPMPAPEPAPAAAHQIIYKQPTRYVVAFAAPAGDVLGPIPAPAASQILARYGDAWLMTAWQNNNVWVRAADVGLLLEDLEQAPVIAPAPAPANDTQYYATASAPAQPPVTDWTPSNRASDEEIQRATDAWLAANQAMLDRQSPETRQQAPLLVEQMPCHCP